MGRSFRHRWHRAAISVSYKIDDLVNSGAQIREFPNASIANVSRCEICPTRSVAADFFRPTRRSPRRPEAPSPTRMLRCTSTAPPAPLAEAPR
ncbi:hypothetical protein I545_4470 [Mycobacterium kansasii 662]|uniref:Uncharacterized protein n=2 Tax=Mycobacterium kansasii TaxID=1768 RepID=A0A1V3WPY2_MYCKA|nr:hypothetical protein I545_4470 [Mycobacterium kansasii 662]KEP44194.1 hypothetical protein MKSMC1_05550 [Mycobacterium kansasii]OOK69044.1 hypothetical protein BZL30_7201 [Mycobacterium kansasii]OOK69731.1 hypothetical protein BZL29_6321 [Mycobacterium kansasii]